MKRIFLAAGEASGDLQAAILVRALRARRADLEFWGVGGERMEAEGVRLLLRSEELAVVGLAEVLARLPRLLAALGTVAGALGELRPDLFVPIDFPDFNFRLLPRAFRLGIPAVYYISPQLWAWRPGRVRVLRRFVRRVVAIFPFEEEFYRAHRVAVTWVGHPLVGLLLPAGPPNEERSRLGLAPAPGPVVALLPGSRHSEIRRIAPLLRSAAEVVDRARDLAGEAPVTWIGGLAPGLAPTELDLPGVRQWLPGIDALRAADFGIVASGTVTLEALLLERPVIVTYRLNPLTYALARRLVRVEHIAMANLVAGRRVLPELVQDDATPASLAQAALVWLRDPRARAETAQGLKEARVRLGPPGAADRAAAVILDEMQVFR
jgi:lipid-A-disaccharide synthase